MLPLSHKFCVKWDGLSLRHDTTPPTCHFFHSSGKIVDNFSNLILELRSSWSGVIKGGPGQCILGRCSYIDSGLWSMLSIPWLENQMMCDTCSKNHISVAWCKTAVSLVLWQWRYHPMRKKLATVTAQGELTVSSRWPKWSQPAYIVLLWVIDIDGLVQSCSNSIANALELLQSCTKRSI